jgi:hypothetical protein
LFGIIELSALCLFTLLQGKYKQEYIDVLNESNLSRMLMGTASSTSNPKLREYLSRILSTVADASEQASKSTESTEQPEPVPAS